MAHLAGGGNVSRMTDDQLYVALQEIDATPCDSEATEEILLRRAERIEEELSQRESERAVNPSPGARDTDTGQRSYTE